MAEYVERKAAYALAKKICDAIRNREYHPATFGHLILDWIDDLPAADVAPVRHGKWIATYGDSWKCSVCGAESYVDEDWHGKDDKAYQMNYCHYCGAKMDGGGE